jgi:hypothetical protein
VDGSSARSHHKHWTLQLAARSNVGSKLIPERHNPRLHISSGTVDRKNLSLVTCALKVGSQPVWKRWKISVCNRHSQLNVSFTKDYDNGSRMLLDRFIAQSLLLSRYGSVVQAFVISHLNHLTTGEKMHSMIGYAQSFLQRAIPHGCEAPICK